MAIFGGAQGQGKLVPDDLFILETKTNLNDWTWHKIINKGKGPGKRYGHTILYYKPYLLIIGGLLSDNKCAKEIYFAYINENNIFNSIYWELLKINDNFLIPCPRMYHACSFYKYGDFKNTIIIYGGRDVNNNSLNDIWLLRRYSDKSWYWEKISYKNKYNPYKRFYHTIELFYNYLIVIGGKAKNNNNSLPIEIFDIKTSEWFNTGFYYNKFRHASFLVGDQIYSFGGLLLGKSLEKDDTYIIICVNKLLNSNDKLKKKEKNEEEEAIKKDNNKNSKINLENINKLGEESIELVFNSIDQKIQNYKINCLSSNVFAEVEERLYKEFPEFREKDNYFLINGIKVKRFKTISQNDIKSGQIILLINEV